MSKSRVLREINNRMELYNLFVRVAKKIREEKRTPQRG